MTSKPGTQIIAIHILPNTLRSKSNQTMKFCQLIESNTRNIFPEKSFTKFGGTTIQFVFILCHVEGYQNKLKLSEKPLAFTSHKFFKKNRGLELVSLP